MKEKKNILVAVSGGIAAYKSVEICSRLVKLGYNVDVMMTESATAFVSELTFRSITNNRVITNMFNSPQELDTEHISLAKKADLVLVAPATYNIIGKIASGIADDFVSTTISASTAPVFFAMGMNNNMYDNPILKKNVNMLKELGYYFLDTDFGYLACGDVAKGRMKSPEEIVSTVDSYLNNSDEFKGKKVLITAGGTIERIDPVRFISNFSSGKSAKYIADEFYKKGADVTIIYGNVKTEFSSNTNNIKIESTLQMLDKVNEKISETDILIMCAAPSDYRPKKYYDKKLKKEYNLDKIELVENPDILCSLKENNALIVGFAAETENLIENAKKKLLKKKMDIIVANEISKNNKAFGEENNSVTIIDKQGVIDSYINVHKSYIGKKIVDIVSKREK